MNLKSISKYSVQALLVIIFSVFIALPALIESPKAAFAESKKKNSLEKRASARQKSALRLLDRALKEKDEAKKEQMLREIEAQCAADEAGYDCKDDNGGDLHVDKSTDCSLCDKPTCLTCCDSLGGVRAGTCKQQICNGGQL